MTKTLKNLFFFICYPRQPAGKVQSFGPEGWGYSEGGQIKTNFSLFSFVCVPVCAKYFWPRETIWPVVFFKKCGYTVFFVDGNVSQVLYIFYINYWTKREQHICARWKVPGWELRHFSCTPRWGIDRQVRHRWVKGTIQRSILQSL